MTLDNGKKVTPIKLFEKFNSTEFLSEIVENSGVNDPKTAPKTKSDSVAAYGRQMASGMIGMLKMFNMNYIHL